jgi:hypothetical protein
MVRLPAADDGQRAAHEAAGQCVALGVVHPKHVKSLYFLQLALPSNNSAYSNSLLGSLADVVDARE